MLNTKSISYFCEPDSETIISDTSNLYFVKCQIDYNSKSKNCTKKPQELKNTFQNIAHLFGR